MDSREIYQEGMRWGPTRIYDRGEPREDIIDLLRRNGRFGYSLVGDMNAQVAACRTGEARFQAILDRFGYETYVEARDEIYRQSEQLERDGGGRAPGRDLSRQTASSTTTGSATARSRCSSGSTSTGDEMKLDLEGSSPQMEGPVNCGFAQTVSACRVAFKLLINPERPVDGGTFHTLDVKAPPASIFDAQEPAACQWYFSSLGLLIDLVVTALAPILPDKVAAAHFGDSMVMFLAGKDPRRGDQPFLHVMPHAGGWGGFEGGDGEDGLINNVNGGFKDYPVEVFEVKYPALIRALRLPARHRRPGRFRGGCGLFRRFEVEPDAYLYLWLERSVTPAWGLFGGRDAIGPEVVVNPGRPDERRMLKVNAHPLAAGLGRRPQDRRRRRLRRPVRARPGARSHRRARRVRQPRGGRARLRRRARRRAGRRRRGDRAVPCYATRAIARSSGDLDSASHGLYGRTPPFVSQRRISIQGGFEGEDRDEKGICAGGCRPRGGRGGHCDAQSGRARRTRKRRSTSASSSRPRRTPTGRRSSRAPRTSRRSTRM